MEVPDIQYTRSGDVAVAYQVVGEGPVDVVWFRGMAGDLLSTWDQPLILRHALGLADSARVLMFDKRGTGLSDRVREAPTLETRMDDVRVVMDAAGSESAVLWTGHEGSRSALLFAATYPERTKGLILLEPSVRGTRTPDYPWAPSEDQWRQRFAAVREGWGRADYLSGLLREWAPALAGDPAFERWFIEHMRRSLSPGAALSFFVEDVRTLGLDIRAGLHTGECELMGKKPSGIAVPIGARVVEAAGPGEVLVSSTVKDLVAGSEISFEDRGLHELKGVGEWRLYAVTG